MDMVNDLTPCVSYPYPISVLYNILLYACICVYIEFASVRDILYTFLSLELNGTVYVWVGGLTALFE